MRVTTRSRMALLPAALLLSYGFQLSAYAAPATLMAVKADTAPKTGSAKTSPAKVRHWLF
jgi:hypothetical protein